MNTMTTGRAAAVPLTRRSAAVLGVASMAGLVMLCWPLLLVAQPGDRVEPPFMFLALLPLVMVVVLAEMGEGGMDSRVLAVLGVLSAINAVMRGLGAGTAGIELVFFLLVLGGRVFGAGFGFVLGCTSLFASALLTAGVGPWLPFQMICAAWVGMGAGLLPRRVSGRAEIGIGDRQRQLAEQRADRVCRQADPGQSESVVGQAVRDQRQQSNHRHHPPAAIVGARQQCPEAGRIGALGRRGRCARGRTRSRARPLEHRNGAAGILGGHRP